LLGYEFQLDAVCWKRFTREQLRFYTQSKVRHSSGPESNPPPFILRSFSLLTGRISEQKNKPPSEERLADIL
jgi:hypothetical protein